MPHDTPAGAPGGVPPVPFPPEPAAASAAARPIFQRLDRSAPSPYSRKEYAGRFTWEVVRLLLFRPSPRRAFRWRAMLLRWFGARIGKPLYVRPTCRVVYPWLLETGDWVQLGDDVVVYNLGPVRIGTHTTVSQGTYLCAGSHDYTQPDLPLTRPPITLGNGVWVAAQAFIGPGVTVGDNSVVGARAVVTRDVPPGVVVGGNPARVIKPRPMKSAE